MRLIGPAVAAFLCCAPAAAADLSGEFGVVSDYRYRGLSLSSGRPALQGTLTLEHESGLYSEVWASTLGGGETEVDFTAGYARDLSDQFGLDLSANYYSYPGAGSGNYVEFTAVSTASSGNASANFGLSYVPRQRATDKRENVYLFGSTEYALPATPITLTAGLGFERGVFDEVEQGGKWDWSLGAEIEAAPAKIGVAWTGSNAGQDALVASLFLIF